ncbi:MAG: RpiB/LacA/LacB family sugar-phosphate isomerase, partial [Vicinamibacterales bacterium]
HNDLNVLALGARVIPESRARDIVRTFLQTPFEAGRHAKRVEKIEQR